MSAARDYIETRLDRRLSLADLAGAAGLSPFHFHRVFVQAYGATPRGYIRARRVGRAKQLLLSQPAQPFAEIALDCGYASQSHFSDAFRDATGATPGAYRREHCNAVSAKND